MKPGRKYRELRRSILSGIGIFVFLGNVWAQTTFTVTGTITDEDSGDELPGALIRVHSNSSGSQTIVIIFWQGQITTAKVGSRTLGISIDEFGNTSGRTNGAVRHEKGVTDLVHKVFHNGPKALRGISRTRSVNLQDVMGSDTRGRGQQGQPKGSRSLKHRHGPKKRWKGAKKQLNAGAMALLSLVWQGRSESWVIWFGGS